MTVESLLVTSLFRSQYVVYIENVVAVLIVVAVVFDTLAGLGQDSPRVS